MEQKTYFEWLTDKVFEIQASNQVFDADRFLDSLNLTRKYLLSGKSYGASIEKEIKEWDIDFVNPSNKLDYRFERSSYDMYVMNNNIRVELKASRVVEKRGQTPMIDRFLSYYDYDGEPFWCNVQQVKQKLSDYVMIILDWYDEK